MNIKLVLRDANGKWLEKKFQSREEAYLYCLTMPDDLEILVVAMNIVLLYSSLMGPPIDKEDLVGFFA